MSNPLVSCLMPTANRRQYVPLAVAMFLAQDYGPRELIVLDDGRDPVADVIPRDPRIRYRYVCGGHSLGEKRNNSCRLARGEILVHWDDDDWSAPWRLSYQVGELQETAADVCGLDRLRFYDEERDLAWIYQYQESRTPWLAGNTLCYKRQLWEKHPFPDITIGEDSVWIAEAVGARVLPLVRDDFFVARVHAGNTSPKETDSWETADPSRMQSWLERALSGC
jgi:O-antigen biosynthesis protein